MVIPESVISLFAVFFLLVELVAILAAFHAVMNARTSQSAIAWAIALTTFPWLTLPLYAVFGRDKFQGYVFLRNSRDRGVRYLIEKVQRQAREKEMVRQELSDQETALTALSHMPITRYNRGRLLVDGNDTFGAILKGIDDAEKYILVLFYIVKGDQLGQNLKNRLIQKAKQGVEVYFLYDEIGSHKLPDDYVEEMNTAGIHTSAFGTTRGKANRFQLNFRNHRKIVVVDGQTAWVGGHNVGDEYMGRHKKFGAWRDTHVEVSGPVVKSIQYCFLEDWFWATAQIPGLDWSLEKAGGGSQDMLAIASGPADALETCGLMFVQAIHAAKERIWIASPYFVPDQQTLSALKLAALRGVDVRILLPEKPDHRTVYLASFACYEKILPVGVKLYRYTAGFMHQKVFLVDSACAAVGTANLDNRSFRLNFEITLLNFSPDFTREVEEMLARDFGRSRQVLLSDYTDRSLVFKVAVRTARLLAPIL